MSVLWWQGSQLLCKQLADRVHDRGRTDSIGGKVGKVSIKGVFLRLGVFDTVHAERGVCTAIAVAVAFAASVLQCCSCRCC